MRHATRFQSPLIIALGLAVGMLSAVGAARQPESAPALLRHAIDKEIIDGDIRGAITEYQRITTRYAKTDRATAARALMRLAEAYQKLGNADAERIYRELVHDYPEQKELVSTATARLAALRSVTGGLASGPVCTGCVGPYVHSFTLSPDGRWFGYTAANNDLMARNLETGEVKRLVGSPSESYATQRFRARRAIWSRDGRRVAFSYRDMEAPGSVKDRVNLRVLALDSASEPRTIVDNPDFIYINPAAWSADGESILVTIQRRDFTWQLAWIRAQNGAITQLRSFNWDFNEFRNGPELSPDGGYILYATFAATVESPPPGRTVPRITVPAPRTIHVLSADGTREMTIARSESGWPSPVWSADGSAVLFVSDRGNSGTKDVWSVQVREGNAVGNPAILKPSIGTDAQLVGTTRLGTLYYVQPQTQDERILIAEMSGRGSRTPTEITTGMTGTYPSWSPDGKQLAWWLWNPGELNVLSYESGQVTKLRLPPGRLSAAPVWLPDGTAMVLALRNPPRAPAISVVRVPLDRSEPRILGTYTPKDRETWSTPFTLAPNRDGILVASTVQGSPRRSLMVIDFNGGAPSPVVADAGDAMRLEARSEISVGLVTETVWNPVQMLGAATAPDGRVALIRVRDNQTYMSIRSADGSSEHDLYGPVPTRNWRNTLVSRLGEPKWLAPGLGIAVAMMEGDLSWTLMRVAEDGRVEPLGAPGKPFTLPPDTLAFDVSPDGKRVAYERMITFSGELAALDLRSLRKDISR